MALAEKFMMMRPFSIVTSCLAFLCVLGSCVKEHDDPNRKEGPRNVMIVYAAGFNNLSTDIEKNINDLQKGFIPSKDGNVLIVCSKLPRKSGDYSRVSPRIVRYYQKKGRPVADTLSTLGFDDNLSDPNVLKQTLIQIREWFPGSHYGLIVSSHATGWLPIGYFGNPSRYDATLSSRVKPSSVFEKGDPSIVPYVEPDSAFPLTKSIFSDHVTASTVQEMELQTFVDAIPVHLDYLLFDACLMGGVEVFYALKDKCDLIAASPAEVLAQGFDYTTMAASLIGTDNPNPLAVCQAYYDFYASQDGQYRSATITLVDPSRMEHLAQVCKKVFQAHSEGLASLAIDPSTQTNGVQEYFYTRSRHWHYDLRDIMAKGGASAEELAEVDSALAECIVYKASTPEFLGTAIKSYSGMSMYLPADGSRYLDMKYVDTAWNRATGLVK